MPETIACTPCCPTVPPVNVPGLEGLPGSDGTNGLDSYTSTTEDFTVPAIGDDVTISVVNSLWMVVGQNVVVAGPATFQVASVPTATTATLTFLGYGNDVAPATVIASGATVGPAGTQPVLNTLSVYASGTAYSLTATPAKLAFGTTEPVLTITAAGTWLLLGRVRIDNNAKTTAAVRTITILLRRTNNTAADITNSSAAVKTAIMTTLTFTLTAMDLPPIVYVTANSDDIIQMWGSADDIAGAGTFDAVEASIVAVKLG